MSKLTINPITSKLDVTSSGSTGDFPGTLTIGDATDNVVIGGVGGVHFAGTSRPLDMLGVGSDSSEAYTNDQFGLTSLVGGLDIGIATSTMDEPVGASRVIEILGVDSGVCTKGLLGASYVRKNTTYASEMIMVRLSTMYGSDTWDQASEWRITLDIAAGDITGEFTIFMAPFSLLHYSTIEVYVAIDGATYFTKTTRGFDKSLAGPPAVTENFTNNPSSGTGVVIELNSTTDLYPGNEAFLTDSAGSEWARITAVSLDTSITVATLINSYTMLNGAKVDTPAYVQTAGAISTRRGIFKLKKFPAGINSGISFIYALPHGTDPDSDIVLILNYVSSDDNPIGHIAKFRTQYTMTAPPNALPLTMQYGELEYADVTPPATAVNSIATIATIPAAYQDGSHGLGVQVARLGAPGHLDTYTGDIILIATMIVITKNKLGHF